MRSGEQCGSLHEKRCAYMLWGIDDKTHEIVGTDHNLQSLKKGQQGIGKTRLRSMLSKNADFEYHSVMLQGKTVGVLIIPQAVNQTVSFQKLDYIRIGSYTKKLNEYPVLQAKLWDKLRNLKFRKSATPNRISPSPKRCRPLNCTAYFDMLNLPQPTDNEGIAHYMQSGRNLVEQDNGHLSYNKPRGHPLRQEACTLPSAFAQSDPHRSIQRQ